MKSLLRTAILSAGLLSSASAQYTYTTLDNPNTVFSEYKGSIIEGVSGNNIVGQYYDGAQWRGYLFDGSTWTTLDAPDSVGFTAAYGVSGNTVVGSYLDSNSVYRGFSYNSGVYTKIDYSGPLSTDGTTFVLDVSESKILATVTDLEGFQKVAVFDGANWTLLSYPSPNTSTAAIAFSGSNILGYYQNESDSGYFKYDGVNWTTLNNHPNSIGTTYFWGATGQNVYGLYSNRNSYQTDPYGTPFIYDGSNWTDINPPSGDITGSVFIKGMNDSTLYGQIQRGSDNSMHGFIATIPEPSTYALFGLGGLALLIAYRRRKVA